MQLEMKYIYQIYLDGSFSKAARSLYITQPALSMAVQKVESELGMSIFDRSTRPLTLTHAGHIYINTIKDMMLLEDNMHKHIDDIQNLNCGSLILGGTHYVNAHVLPDILPGFHAKYPNIDIRILEHGSSVLTNMLEEHQLDFYFSCDPKLITAFPGRKIFTDQLLLAVPEAYGINSELAGYSFSASDICSLAHLSPEHPAISLALFKDTPFLLLFEGSNFYERAAGMFQEAGLIPNIKMRLSQSVTAFRFAAAGLGATFVVDRLVKSTDDRLRYYKLDSAYAKRHNYLLHPKHKYVTAAMNAFIQYASRRFSSPAAREAP